jgi:hypothetical protein
MARGQLQELRAPAAEKRIGADDERTGLSWTRVAKAASISSSVLAFRIGSCTPFVRAASCKSLTRPSALGGSVRVHE